MRQIALILTVVAAIAWSSSPAQGASTSERPSNGTAIQQASYTESSNLTMGVNVSGRQLDDAIRAIRPGSPLIGVGDTVVRVADQEGLNAIYIVAHAAWESAWGTSAIAQSKKNLFGWRAFDSCPYSCAMSFPSMAASIEYVVPRIKALYLTPGGPYYTHLGPTLRGMNGHYATDPNWASGIAGVMNAIAARIAPEQRVSDGAIWYVGHFACSGDTTAAKNGEVLQGTRCDRKLEAVRVDLEGVPGRITCQAHVQDFGTLLPVGEHATIGTTGLARRLEALRCWLEGAPAGVGISYRLHVEGRGWTMAHDGAWAGTIGQGLPVTAIAMQLSQN